jgi:hypothetical protein
MKNVGVVSVHSSIRHSAACGGTMFAFFAVDTRSMTDGLHEDQMRQGDCGVP